MRPRRTPLFVLAVVLGAFLLPSIADAETPIFSFGADPSSTEAGGHPDVAFDFVLSNRQFSPDHCSCKQDARTINVNLPTGLIGNPHATPQCTIAQFSSRQCPPDAQVGVSEDNFTLFEAPGFAGAFVAPVYNLIPPPNAPALFAFEALFGSPVFIKIAARTESDYGIDATVADINHTVPLERSNNVFWGVPADPKHDYLRWGQGQGTVLKLGIESFFCDLEGKASAATDPGSVYQICQFNQDGSRLLYGPIGALTQIGGPGHIVSSSSPLIPFFQNPTTCGTTSLATSLDILSYDGGTSHADSLYPPTTDCDKLSFNPSQAIEPTTTASDSPSGAEFRLTVPQFESPLVPSPSELKAASVTLPPGFSIAPNLTNGKTICTAAQARIGTREEAHCPENAKIGTLTVETPVLPGPLPGAVYLSEPEPGAGAVQYADGSGGARRYGLLLVFDGFGVHVKIPGVLTPDPQTGQIFINFENLPQAPFADFNMHVFGSERGPLATPTRCGTYEVSSVWTPWDASLSEQTSRQFFTIDEGPDGQPCPSGPRRFAPGFQAASTISTGGAHTSFWLNLTRSDGEQNLSSLSIATPPGFSATLKGIPYCPESDIARLSDPAYSGVSEQASPLCPASLLGTATAAAGAGTHPLYLPGRVYLAGPYKGAPLSLEVVIPAVSGPYDLGNVAVRAAVRVNPETAQITTVSDPLPQIFGGIPIRVRQVFVNLNRPGFALNPTDCEPLSVTGRLTGDEGTQTAVSSHFQASNCASLPFAPKLSLKLSGGLNRLGHPAIHSTFTAKPGEANTRSVSVALPKGEILDNAHIKGPCTRVQLNAGSCPPSSVLGHAVADTPLLDQPLEGPVYLTTGFGHQLPDLVADLHGQIHVILDGKVDTTGGGSLRTTFQTVPDAPISSFKLDLAGGARGLVQNTESLCGAHKSALVAIDGQNGAALTRKVPLQLACGAAKHKRKVHKARRAGQ